MPFAGISLPPEKRNGFSPNQTHIGPEVWLSLPLNDPALPTNLSSPVSLSDANKGPNIKA